MSTSTTPLAYVYDGRRCLGHILDRGKAGFEAFQKRMWEFIPYVPGGQFDINNAYGKNISGVLDGYVIIYWNIEKS